MSTNAVLAPNGHIGIRMLKNGGSIAQRHPQNPASSNFPKLRVDYMGINGKTKPWEQKPLA